MSPNNQSSVSDGTEQAYPHLSSHHKQVSPYESSRENQPSLSEKT